MATDNPDTQSAAHSPSEGAVSVPTPIHEQVHVLGAQIEAGYTHMDTNTQLLVTLLQAQTDHFNQRFDSLEKTVAGTNLRLDALNGRLRKAETNITRLKVTMSGAVAVVGIAVGAFFKHLFG